MYITLSQKITDKLRQRILSAHYAPGHRLEEIPLSQEWGVSRTPVRAALASLANTGLLDYQPKRGYVVSQFGEKILLDAYEARATLEGLACRKATENGLSKEHLTFLQRQLEIGDRILGTGRLPEDEIGPYQRMNVDFHQTIIEVANNSWISRFVRETHEIPLVSQRTMLWHDYAVICRSHDDHHRILDAIMLGQHARAEELMREHIYFAGMFMLKNIHLIYGAHANPRSSGSRITLENKFEIA